MMTTIFKTVGITLAIAAVATIAGFRALIQLILLVCHKIDGAVDNLFDWMYE